MSELDSVTAEIEKLDAAFHKLWTAHVDREGYDKAGWSELYNLQTALTYGTIKNLVRSHYELLEAAKEICVPGLIQFERLEAAIDTATTSTARVATT